MKGICLFCENEFNCNRKGQIYCSSICTLIRHNKNRKLAKKECNKCEKLYQPVKSKQKFCSVNCVSENRIGNDVYREYCRKGGQKGASISNNRSKNEIYFYELCNEKYINVESNPRIFDGFDADVVLMDEQIAVEWNGKWHYETIIKGRSLLQIQTKDKIKNKIIIRKGFIPYTIKDMGKHNKKFVEMQFKTFNEFVNDLFMITWHNYW